MASLSKTKRVRTGCLTCRARHLKCDEQSPECLNCRKSKRFCDRSRRIKFDHYIKVKPLQYTVRDQSFGGVFEFHDESRDIASQYEGGLRRYPLLGGDILDCSDHESEGSETESVKGESSELDSSPAVSNNCTYMAKSSTSCAGPSTGSKPLSSSQLLLDAINTTAGTTDMGYNMMAASLYFGSDATMSTSYGGYSGSRLLTPSDSQSAEDAHTAAYGNLNISSCDGYAQSENLGSSFQSFNLESSPQLGTQSTSSRVSLGDGCESRSDPEDLQYLQNFIDDMAGLMNAFDGARHAERFIPHRAMRCPPLLSALLAYGASFVSRETAHRHYDAATQRIKSEKEGSTVSRVIDSDKLADLAMAAVVLYIYETTRSTLERTSVHTSEARDLIQQGQWDGSSPGLGGACFWLFVATEVMISLERNWQVTWKPDTWAVDMNMTFIGEESWNVDGGSDEIWVHRIFFIMAKISDFRATASEFDVNDLRQMLGERLPQWRQLEKLCQKWSGACPLTMRPYAYIDRGAPGIKSRFPLIRFSTLSGTVSRLVYHMSRCILAQTNPRAPLKSSREMKRMELHHAQQICGIVATTGSATRLRPGAAVARSLAIAQEALDDPQEKEELRSLMMSSQGSLDGSYL